MLAIGAIFLVQALDDSLNTPDDVKRHLSLPVLGAIPEYETGTNTPISLTEPRSPINDAYRTVRANIHFAGVDQTIKRLLVTSTNPSEGKTTLAANLAIISAQHSTYTLVIDADFRKPMLNKRFGLPNRRGLSDYFTTEIGQNGAVQSLDLPNLKVLATGPLPPNPTELLGSKKMAAILDLFAEKTDILIVDTPPLMVVSDAAVLSSIVDGTVLVVKSGSTKIKAAQDTIERLQLANANILGVVLIGVDIRHHAYYYGAYKAYNMDPERENTGVFSRFRRRRPK